MSAIMSLMVLVLATLCSFPSSVLGSAVLQQKYHLYVSTQYKFYNTDHFWDASGNRKDACNTFKKKMGELYLEYGLTNCDTLTAKAGWARIAESVNGRTFGFTDIELGWKRSFGILWDHYVSTELLVIVPPEGTYEPGLRYGKWGGEFDLLASRGFSICDRFGWYDLRLGYRKYVDFPSDQIRADAIVYWQPIDRITVAIGSILEYGLFNGSSRIDESLILFNPNYRLWKGKIEAYAHVWGGAFLMVGYDRHLWGRNVGTGGQFYGGASIQF